MSHHFEQGLMGGDRDFNFKTPESQSSNRQLFDDSDFWSRSDDSTESPQSSSSWEPMQLWNLDQSPDWTPPSQPFTAPLPINSTVSPHLVEYSPAYSSKSGSSSQRTSVDTPSPTSSTGKKSILQQLLEDDDFPPRPKPVEKPSRPISPKIKRRATRRPRKKSTTPDPYPPSMKIYEENWLNEVYWYNYHSFMKTHYYDVMAQPPPPPNPAKSSAPQPWNADMPNGS